MEKANQYLQTLASDENGKSVISETTLLKSIEHLCNKCGVEKAAVKLGAPKDMVEEIFNKLIKGKK